MWISKKKWRQTQRRIADLERQVRSQLFTIEMCRKIDTSAFEVIKEVSGQSSGNSSSGNGSIL